MPRVSLAFFTAAALCGLFGVGMGIVMGASQDFTLSPVHAHLNLVGWASLALMGVFYALTGTSRLAWANFALSALGVAIFVPSLAVYLQSHEPNLGLQIGPLIVGAGWVVFVLAVLTRWLKPVAAAPV